VDNTDCVILTQSFLDSDIAHPPFKLPSHPADTSSNIPLWRGIGMTRGNRTSLTIRVTAKERRTLQAWQWSKTIPAGRARRGKVILLMADQVPITHIAAMVGISRRFVYKWVHRFLQEGLAGLADKTEAAAPAWPEGHEVTRVGRRLTRV
jgi:hypothetical protein